MITTPTQIQPSPVVVALLSQPAVFATVQNDDPNSGPAIVADIDRVIALGRVARPTKEQLHSFILESGELLEPPKDFDTESGNNKIEDFHSAGCLVISDKKRSGYTALAIQRKGDDAKLDYGYGLPCGKKEAADQTIVDTAVRETFEEAQVMPRVILKIPPFVAVEAASGKSKAVATFLAVSDIESPDSFEGESDEGKVTFMNPKALLYGPFGGYNKSMLSHFAPYIDRLPIPYSAPRYAQNLTFDFEVFNFTPAGMALYLAQPAGQRKLSMSMFERTLIRHTGTLPVRNFVPLTPLTRSQLADVEKVWRGGDDRWDVGFIDGFMNKYLLWLSEENFVDTVFEGKNEKMYFSSVLQKWVIFDPYEHSKKEATAYSIVKAGFFKMRYGMTEDKFSADVTLRKLLAHHWTLPTDPMTRAEHQELCGLLKACIGYDIYDVVEFDAQLGWGPSIFFIR